MNGIGIGTAVGLGALIGLGIVSPGAQVAEYLMTGLIYGALTGFVFELYRLAFSWRHPFGRR